MAESFGPLRRGEFLRESTLPGRLPREAVFILGPEPFALERPDVPSSAFGGAGLSHGSPTVERPRDSPDKPRRSPVPPGTRNLRDPTRSGGTDGGRVVLPLNPSPTFLDGEA